MNDSWGHSNHQQVAVLAAGVWQWLAGTTHRLRWWQRRRQTKQGRPAGICGDGGEDGLSMDCLQAAAVVSAVRRGGWAVTAHRHQRQQPISGLFLFFSSSSCEPGCLLKFSKPKMSYMRKLSHCMLLHSWEQSNNFLGRYVRSVGCSSVYLGR